MRLGGVVAAVTFVSLSLVVSALDDCTVPNCDKCNVTSICDECSDGYLVMYNPARCDKCVDNCLECSEKYTCNKCADGYRFGDLFENEKACERDCIKNCVACTDKSTCDECAVGYGTKGNDAQCAECIDNCDECSTDDASCDKCAKGYKPGDDEKKTCVPLCIDNCDECSDTSTCDKCAAGYLIADPARMKCGQCTIEHCVEYKEFDLDTCETCEVGYKNYRGLCVVNAKAAQPDSKKEADEDDDDIYFYGGLMFVIVIVAALGVFMRRKIAFLSCQKQKKKRGLPLYSPASASGDGYAPVPNTDLSMSS